MKGWKVSDMILTVKSVARKLESSPNLAFYPSRAALKEAILGDKNVLNETSL